MNRILKLVRDKEICVYTSLHFLDEFLASLGVNIERKHLLYSTDIG